MLCCLRCALLTSCSLRSGTKPSQLGALACRQQPGRAAERDYTLGHSARDSVVAERSQRLLLVACVSWLCLVVSRNASLTHRTSLLSQRRSGPSKMIPLLPNQSSMSTPLLLRTPRTILCSHNSRNRMNFNAQALLKPSMPQCTRDGGSSICSRADPEPGGDPEPPEPAEAKVCFSFVADRCSVGHFGSADLGATWECKVSCDRQTVRCWRHLQRRHRRARRLSA